MTLDENGRWVTIRPTQGNLQLHIRTWTGSGRPFVLVHGLSSNCRTWEQTAQKLALAGHQVVTVDQRGHGLSDKPNSGYDFATVCEDLLLLCNALALDTPLIAGQSWGGNVVLEFGARYPGRAGGFAFVDGGTIDLQGRPDATWERTLVELRPPTLTGMPRTVLAERIAAMHPGWNAAGIEATLANFETLPDGTVRPWLSLDRHLTILRAMWEQRPPMLYPLLREPVLICPSSDPHNPAGLDTSRCYVGVERFTQLMEMLPGAVEEYTIVGIDEKTALIVDLVAEQCHVLGAGGVTLVNTRQEQMFPHGATFRIQALGAFQPLSAPGNVSPAVWATVEAGRKAARALQPQPSNQVIALMDQREDARRKQDWAASDRLRAQIAALGWRVLDSAAGAVVEPIDGGSVP